MFFHVVHVCFPFLFFNGVFQVFPSLFEGCSKVVPRFFARFLNKGFLRSFTGFSKVVPGVFEGFSKVVLRSFHGFLELFQISHVRCLGLDSAYMCWSGSTWHKIVVQFS